MEEYKKIAPDTFNATATAAEDSNEDEALHQSMDIARQLETELKRNHLPNVRLLKAISGNGTKRLKARQKTRVGTQASNVKNAKAAIK